MLELLRHHSFRAEQPNERGEIYVLPPLETPSGESSATESAVISQEAEVVGEEVTIAEDAA